ncbi:MAG: LPS assembly protein LptD [Thiogranum sp.]|nr:LPS assembly protein LptD [Thiogranum sp.]
MNIRSLSLLFAALVTGAPASSAEDAVADTDSPVPFAETIDSYRESPYAPVSAWAMCPPQPARDFVPASRGNREQAETNLAGDLASMSSAGTYTLIGEAEAIRADQRLKADLLIYDQTAATVSVEREVRYDEPDLSLTASYGKLWLDEDRGEFHDTRYRLYDSHARGGAEISYLLEPGITQYRRATYTTCPDDSDVWMLAASKVTMYKERGEGIARHARLDIKGVPVLYTPYISFPIDDRRKTGFLVPSFGSSDNSGFELRLPYYLNLAPNYDATLTPRYLQYRGTQINAEARHMSDGADSHTETIVNVEYLHQDDLVDDSRSRVSVRNASRFGDHLSTNIYYDQVSDSDYINDLGDSLSLASVTHLQRTFRADYNTSWWQAGLSVDDYQTVDETIAPANRPYERLPRLTFNTSAPPNRFGLEMASDSEFVRFDQDARVTGNRFNIYPSVSLPVYRSAFDITPKFGVRYTSYKLDGQAPGRPDDPSRTVPVFSLDNVLYLERDFELASRSYLQTLEPRVYYLYVDRRDQDEIPLFDTSEPEFTYQELFQENRFNGVDRIGDANQVTLAVTTRLLDSRTGAEKIRASVGEIFYLQDREVTLSGADSIDERKSDIAGELDMTLSRAWRGKADIVWSPNEQQTQQANTRLQYNPGFRKIANLSYRYRNGTQDQIDASVLWPLSPSWHVLGRWYYDIDNTQELETMAGIEYDSCCWGIRLVTRRYLDNDGETTNQSIMFQFVLKGLTQIGSNIESLLEDGILGYTERPED